MCAGLEDELYAPSTSTLLLNPAVYPLFDLLFCCYLPFSLCSNCQAFLTVSWVCDNCPWMWLCTYVLLYLEPLPVPLTSSFLFPLLPQSLCSEVSFSCWWASEPQDLLAWMSPALCWLCVSLTDDHVILRTCLHEHFLDYFRLAVCLINWWPYDPQGSLVWTSSRPL